MALLPPARPSAYVYVAILLALAMLNATTVNARTSLWQTPPLR